MSFTTYAKSKVLENSHFKWRLLKALCSLLLITLVTLNTSLLQANSKEVTKNGYTLSKSRFESLNLPPKCEENQINPISDSEPGSLFSSEPDSGSEAPTVRCFYQPLFKRPSELIVEFNSILFANPFNNLTRCHNSSLSTSTQTDCGDIYVERSRSPRVVFVFRKKDPQLRESLKNNFKNIMSRLDINETPDISYEIELETFLVTSTQTDSREFSLYAQHLGLLPQDTSRVTIDSTASTGPSVFINGGNLATSLLSARFGKLKMNQYVQEQSKWKFSGILDRVFFSKNIKETLYESSSTYETRTGDLQVSLNGRISAYQDKLGFVKVDGIFLKISRLSENEKSLVKEFTDSLEFPKYTPLDTPIFITSTTVGHKNTEKSTCWFCSKKSKTQVQSVYEVYLTIRSRDIQKIKKTNPVSRSNTQLASSPSSQNFSNDLFQFVRSIQFIPRGIDELYESDFAHKIFIQADPNLFRSDFIGKNLKYQIRLMKNNSVEINTPPIHTGELRIENLLNFELPKFKVKDLLMNNLKSDVIHFSLDLSYKKTHYKFYAAYHTSIDAYSIVEDEIIRPQKPTEKNNFMLFDGEFYGDK